MTALFRAIFIVTAAAAWCDVVSAAEMEANAIFLVAKPELSDPNFRETVVLVTHPRQGGPWGVIINRPLQHRLSEVLPDFESLRGSKDVLFFGGPVLRQGLVFLVRSPKSPPGATQVLRDVFFTPDTGLIDSLLKRPDPARGLRVYSGHSGWSPGQLQNEIARGDWHILPADAATVFDKDPALVWPELVKRAATKQTWRDEGGGMRDEERVRKTGNVNRETEDRVNRVSAIYDSRFILFNTPLRGTFHAGRWPPVVTEFSSDRQ